MNPATRREARILVVDDEPLVLEMVRMVLRTCGYTVDAYTSPVDALQFYRGENGAVDLAVIDLSMPVLSGADLAKALRATRPALPIIFTSGYGQPEKFGSTAETKGTAFVHKPFNTNELLTAVRELLRVRARAADSDANA